MHNGQNAEWTLDRNADGSMPWDGVHAALAMDLRNYLRRMTNVLECRNATRIPRVLDKIERHLRPVRPTHKQAIRRARAYRAGR